ncbi:hypothetical protein KKG77_00955 [bacterium]|nr:hypothetical protein [bacterium]
MLEVNDYELLKKSFIDSQRLFSKLRTAIYNASNIEYDGTGMYSDEEELYERHRATLSSKILLDLSATLDEYKIELRINNDLSLKELIFNLQKDDVISVIKVDFSEEESLNILQLS